MKLWSIYSTSYQKVDGSGPTRIGILCEALDHSGFYITVDDVPYLINAEIGMDKMLSG